GGRNDGASLTDSPASKTGGRPGDVVLVGEGSSRLCYPRSLAGKLFLDLATLVADDGRRTAGMDPPSRAPAEVRSVPIGGPSHGRNREEHEDWSSAEGRAEAGKAAQDGQ